MDLLLTHGYCLADDPLEQRIMRPYPPLGLLYLTSHLRRAGFDVDVCDPTFGSRDDVLEILDRDRPPVVGIYGNLMTRPGVLRIQRACRARGIRVVLGGPEPASWAGEYLRRGADVVVRGEGEKTMEELLPRLMADDPGDFGDVDGLLFLDGDRVVETAPRTQIPDLDSQPWPARDAIDLAPYLDAWKRAHGQSSVSLITARGCPYRCRWCSHAVYGHTHRRRSPRGVADEVEHIVETWDPDLLWYADDVFTIHHRWLREYAEELGRRGLHRPFETITREDRLDEGIVDLLARMGCFRLWIGAESGSQRLLDRMERRTSAERTREMIRLVQSRGIEAGTFIMVGYESETLEDLHETVRHLVAALPDRLLTTTSYPIRGTAYHREVEDRLRDPEGWDWETGSDRDAVISGRHQRPYYDHAQRWIHHEVEAARARSRGTAGLPRYLRSRAGSMVGRLGMWRWRNRLEP